ncbi:MAG: hypothetical protein ABS36_17935 [Acidobacteria bacterium SCN 69-37]|nr:MAG: hypothetical protein ABS36_17935 [Acidobacteria bacterium SCN 69-37]
MFATRMSFSSKAAVFVTTLVVALTRWPALSQTFLDWDEALFVLAVDDYDVALQRPHAPGYPLFIAAAKLAYAAGFDAFHALQAVVFLGAVCLVPAAYLLARQLGFRATTALGGAVILAFLPNVWVYGGTAFSDVPALTLGLTACALLLRGRTCSRAFVAGGIVLGCALGIRPATIIVAVVPLAIGAIGRLRERRWGPLVASGLLVALIGGGSYVGAACASRSVEDYQAAVREQSEWVRHVDSYRNPARPPLTDVAATFLLHPYDQPQQLTALIALAAVSLVAAAVRRRGAPWGSLALFAPLMGFSVLSLDVQTPARYAVAYMFPYAMLAADGLGVIVRRPRWQFAAAAVGALALATWTWPAIRLQATSDAPPVAALRWVHSHSPRNADVFVSVGFRPQAAALLTRRQIIYFEDDQTIGPEETAGWVVDWRPIPQAKAFEWEHDRLWRVVRQRGFAAYALRLGDVHHFMDGWFDEGGIDDPRWMGRESRTWLPSRSGSMRLDLVLGAPLDLFTARPTVEVLVDDEVLDRFVLTDGEMTKSWIVPPGTSTAAFRELRLRSDTTVVPARVWSSSTDERELGLLLRHLDWRAPDDAATP